MFLVGIIKAQTPELIVQTGHSSAISEAIISPDRKYVLSLGGTELILWDFYGRELLKLDAKLIGKSDLAFFPDSKQFLTANLDGSVSHINLKGELIGHYKWHSALVSTVAIAPDGKTILSASWDRTVQLWTIDGQKLNSFRDPDGRVVHAAFSPDGKIILTGTHNHGVKLWDLNGRLLHTFPLHPGFSGACFSPNGQYILAYGSFGAVLWDAQGRKVQEFKGYYSHGAFSPNKEHILLSTSGGMIYAFDFLGNAMLEYKGHEGYIRTLHTYPKEDLILSGDDKGNLKLWSSSRFMRDFRGHTPPVYDADLSPDGRYFAFGGQDQSVKLWRIQDQHLQIFSGHQSSVNTVSFLPGGKQLLSGSEAGKAIVWGLDGKQLDVFQDSSVHHIEDVAYAPDGRWLGATGRNGLVRLWSVPEHRTVDLVVIDSISGMTYDEFNAADTGVGFSPSSTYNAVTFSPDGKMVAVAYGPKVVIFTHEGAALQYISDFPAGVEDITFSPDGELLLAGCSNGILQLRELSGTVVKTFNELNTATVNAVAFSRDGERILAGHADGRVRCWERSGWLKWGFGGHRVSVETVSFTPDSEHFLTGSLDGTLKLWSWQTGKLLATFFSLSGQENAWVQVNGENYYCGTKDLSGFVHFKIGLQAYSFDQFDLRLNRPDKVLESLLPLGAAPDRVRKYRQAYRKRLQRYGFTEAMLSDDFHVPECYIANIDELPIATSESTIRLIVEATDTLEFLDRLNVYINDVPLYGTSGIDLREENTGKYRTTLQVALSQGENKIEVSALNQGGGESLKATTYITRETPASEPELHLIAIGISDYAANGKDLRYAAKDARDIAALYQNAANFQKVHTKVLTDDQATKVNILALRSWLEQSRVDDQVLIYVS
ncbi:MAG: WD40 repeat domain-containing protein, partial [Lewinella sp.]|nr:WD40 repeat domain-containing protein [Lewinella sp.]